MSRLALCVVLSDVQSAGSIHSVAEALLTLIDSFAEPVIPHQFYVRCIEACANETLCKQVSVGSTVFPIVVAFTNRITRAR